MRRFYERDKQLELGKICIGQVVELKVGINAKKNQTDFIPEFVEYDPLIPENYTTRGSVRIIVAINNADLQRGEIWKAEILGIMPTRKLTRDNRHKVFVTVKIIERVEKEERFIDWGLKHKLLIQKKSGSRIISSHSLPVMGEKKMFRVNGGVAEAYVYSVGSQVVEVLSLGPYSVQKYATDMQKLLGRRLGKTETVRTIIRKLPFLPEAVPLDKITWTSKA